MPLISEQETGFVRHLPESDTEVRENGPAFLDVVQASFENENTFVNFAANGFSLGEEFLPVENYNPMENIQGYELYADSFTESKSPSHTAAIKMQVDNEVTNYQTISNAGVTGFVSQIAAGITDPVYWPLMFTGMGQAKTAVSTGKAFRQSMLVGGLSEVPAEIIKQELQETRTIEESAFNIGGSAILGGLLGAGINKLKNGARESGVNIPKLESDLEDMVTADTPNLSMGAAQRMTMTPEETEIAGLTGLKDIPVSPLIRTMNSVEPRTRQITSELTETPILVKGNIEGKTITPEGGTVETRTKRWDFNLFEGINAVTDSYAKYRKTSTGKMLSKKDFRIEVGRAMRRGDTHKIPEVEQAARDIRSKAINPLKDAAISEKLLPENVDVSTADSYLMRIYNQDRITMRRPEWNKVVDDWLGGIRNRAKLKAADDIAAGKDPSESVKMEAGTSDLELEVARNEITDNILGNSSGRTSYDVVQLERGPLKERVFNIPDSMIEDFLESDVDVVMRQYVKTMAPDIELNRAFGSVDMGSQLDEITNNYTKKINEAGSEKARNKLEKQMKSDIRDLEAMRDRLRGTFMTPKDPTSFFIRAGRTIRDVNFMRLLGGMTLSAIPDAARIVAVNGLRPVGRSLKQLAGSPKRFKMAKAEARKAAVGMEMVLNSRAASLAELTDAYQRGSAFERGLRQASDTFSKLTLMSQWNDALKSFSGVTTSDRILTESLKWADGTITASNMKKLAASGIDEGMAQRIAAQFQKHGDDGSIKLPMGDKWDDIPAMESFRSAVLRDVDRTIVTPGIGEKPLWTSSEAGKMIFQFKTFASAAHHKVFMADLQYADAAALNGFLMATALGGVVYGLKNHVAGRDVSSDPSTIIQESLDRSGVFGYFWDVNNMAAKFTNGQISVERFAGGEPMSRYASRNIWGAMLGPSIDAVEDIRAVTGNISTGEFSDKDIHRIRKMLPGQNLFYMRQLLDKLEEEIQ